MKPLKEAAILLIFIGSCAACLSHIEKDKIFKLFAMLEHNIATIFNTSFTEIYSNNK